MRRVAIASQATAVFSKGSGKSLFELACEPCVELLKGTNAIARSEIDAVLLSTCATDQYSSAILSEMLGIKPRVAHRVDNLCNSGTNAVASAYSMIVSGLCDSALVVGAEKSDSPGNKLVWDLTRGSFMLPVHWASMFAKAHMRRYGTTEEQMAMVSVQNRRQARKNPTALFYKSKPVSVKDVMDSRRIAGPVKLLDCSAPCDGASAVLMVSEEKAREMAGNGDDDISPVWIKGIGQQTNSASFANATAPDLSALQTARLAARRAYEMSQTRPSQIDVAELHDAFTILEILAYEDLGFAQEGKGGRFAEEEKNRQGGVAINPRGGIIGCGHPVGTTGVAQVAEIAAQLGGVAGAGRAGARRRRQVKGCRTGLVHNLAAAGSSATVMVLGVDA